MYSLQYADGIIATYDPEADHWSCPADLQKQDMLNKLFKHSDFHEERYSANPLMTFLKAAGRMTYAEKISMPKAKQSARWTGYQEIN